MQSSDQCVIASFPLGIWSLGFGICVCSVVRLRLATRASRLALAQSGHVADALRAAHPGLDVEMIRVTSTGDRVQDKPLHDIGGKGLFTKEVELAVLDGSADFAVHSYKDVPVTMPLVDQAELTIAAVPTREDPRDVMVIGPAIDDESSITTVGTGSLRRRALLGDACPWYEFVPMRGNVDTRLRKVSEGEVDAVVLAAAGLKRLGLLENLPLDVEWFNTRKIVPAAGQGALALQCRSDRSDVRALLAAIHDPATAASVELEREVVRRLDGDCTSPIGAYHDGTTLTVAVGAAGGVPPVRRGSGTGVDPVTAALSALSASDGAGEKPT
ncbi:MAG: hydroxymethylbilane synthase [Planctomycetota bacterium]